MNIPQSSRVAAFAAVLFAATCFGTTFNVNSTANTPDANPGNGICADANGVCTLRAAIMEANALAGPDTIHLQTTTYTISTPDNPDGALPRITSTIVIDGNGATIRRDAASGTPDFRLFFVGGGDLTLSKLTIANGSGAGGGALRVEGGTATVISSTLRDNQGTSGGAITNNNGTLSVLNSTLTNNLSLDGFGGGGILVVGASPTFIVSSTLAENRAGGPAGFQGRGDALAGSTSVVVRNSILSSPLTGFGNDCYGAGLTSLGHNIASDNSCAFTGTGDKNNTDPLLGPLASNGGPNQTMALVVGSPAIDSVPLADCRDTSGAALTVDQRGTARPLGAACDAGAYEAPNLNYAATATAWNPQPTSPVSLGVNVNLRVTVSPFSGNGAYVVFYDGGNIIGYASVSGSGVASLNTIFTSSGTHYLRAAFSGRATTTTPLSPSSTVVATVQVTSVGGATLAKESPIADSPARNLIVLDNMNNSSRTDIVYGGTQPGFTVLTAGGNMSFTKQTPVTNVVWQSGGVWNEMTNAPTGLATGDFDHDGIKDVVITSGNSLAVIRGSGNGVFPNGVPASTSNAWFAYSFAAGEVVSSPVVADFDGDGDSDIAVLLKNAQELRIFYANGATTRFNLSGVLAASGASPLGLKAADMNRDGRPDLVWINGQVVNYLIATSTGFQPNVALPSAPGTLSALTIADFNNDGFLDVAVLDPITGIVVRLGTASGLPGSSSLNTPLGSVPTMTLASGNFNSDNFMDLVITRNGKLEVWKGDGTGGFQLLWDLDVTGTNGVMVDTSDFSGDGREDVVMANVLGGLSFFRNTTPTNVVRVSGSPQTAAAGTSFSLPLLLEVRNAQGTALQGIPVQFTAGTAASLATSTLSISSVKTGPSGRALTNATANTKVGTYGVTGAATGVTATTTFSLTNTAAAPAAIAVLSGSNQTVDVNLNFANLVALVTDSYGNPVPGVTVTFTAPLSGAGAILTAPSDVTDNLGRAVISAKANTVVGSYVVFAKVGAIGPANFTLTNTSGNSGTKTIAGGDIQTVGTNVALPVAFKVLVKDTFGNPMAQKAVTFSAPTAAGSFAGPVQSVTVNTDPNGFATSPVFTSSNTVGAHTVTAAASATGASLQFTVNVVSTTTTLVVKPGSNSVAGKVVSLVATVTLATATGSVTFYDGPTLLGTSFLNGGVAVFNTVSLAVGSHSVKAVYTGAGATAAVNVTAAPAGVVASWGRNDVGQLGDSTTTNRNQPVGIAGLTGVAAISAGGAHTLALKNDGTAAKAWGLNLYGQLGDGSTTNRNQPVSAIGPAGIVSVAAGSTHSIALKDDGTVYAWGRNDHGQLGDGTSINHPPALVNGLTGIVAIATGAFHSLALKSDGSVWAWGSNSDGQLGDGTFTDRNNPVMIGGFSGTIALAAGFSHSLALKSDGSVWAWGSNQYGQLGDGGNVKKTQPVLTSGNSLIATIAAGGDHSLALKVDGTVWTWGKNFFGELGIGTNTDHNQTVLVTGLTGVVVAIAGGGGHSLALKNDGSLWAWGANDYGQLGIGGTVNQKLPVVVSSVSGAFGIGTGDVTSFALAPVGPPAFITATGGAVQSTPVTTAFGTPLQVTVKDVNNNPVPNASVTFATPLTGASAVVTVAAPTNTSGVTQVTATANGVTGTYAITAMVNGVSTTFNLTNTGGAPATLTISGGTGQQTAVGTAFAQPLAVQVKDSNSNPANATVTFTVPPNGASATLTAAAPTNSLGITQVTATANSIAGSYPITATVNGLQATFILTNLALPPASIGINGGATQSTIVSTAFGTPLSVKVLDATALPVSGALVTFAVQSTTGASATLSAPAATNASGITQVTATANNTAGSYSVTALVNGVSTGVTFSLTNLPAACAPAPSGLLGWWGFSPSTSSQVADLSGKGNNASIIGGLTQSTGKVQGSVATGAAWVSIPDSPSLKFGTGPIAGSMWIRWSNPSANLTDTVLLSKQGSTGGFWFGLTQGLAGSPSSTKLVFLTQDNAGAFEWDSTNRIPLADGNWHLLTFNYQQASVEFTVDGTVVPSMTATGGVPPSKNVDDAAPLLLGAIGTGSLRFTGDLDEVQIFNTAVSPAQFKAIFNADSLGLCLVPVPASIAVNGGGTQSAAVATSFAISLSVRVLDSNSNPLSGALVTFAVPPNGASATLSAPAATNALGITQVTATANATLGSYLITATVNGISTAFNLTNTVGPPVTITISGSASQQTVTSTPFAQPLAVLVRDGQGNLVQNASVTFAALGTTANAVLSSTNAATNPSGIAQIIATANAIAGTYPVMATVNGLTATFTLTNISPTVNTLSTIPAANSLAGRLVSLISTVTPATLTGSVTFYDGTTVLGTSPLNGGLAVFNASILTAGSHSLKADYTGILATTSLNVTSAPEGVVLSRGYNQYGQFGDGTTSSTINIQPPSAVIGLTPVLSIRCGAEYCIGLKSDGTVWSWGKNTFGQLGDGTSTDRTHAVPVSGLSGIVDIAAGEDFAFAIKTDGTAWSWGRNLNGQLGDGSFSGRTLPVQVAGLTGIVSIAAGASHTVALKNDGTVWAWGSNGYGEVGDGTNANRNQPVQLTLLSGMIHVGAGINHSLAAKSDGTVWAWGSNSVGQLGDGTTTNRLQPVPVTGLTGAFRLAAGYQSSFALKSDGTVWSWGYNSDSELGDGTTANRSLPVAVTGLTGVVQISAKFLFGMALKSDGTVWGWGSNGFGQLGDGTLYINRGLSVQASGISSALGVAAAYYHSAVIVPAATGASISATGGATQSIALNTVFATPLQVTVKDSGNLPVANVLVAFTALGSTANAILSTTIVPTNANGVAQVTATANGTIGSYLVSASIGGASATFNLTNQNPAPASIAVNGGGTQAVTIGTPFSTPLSVKILDGSGNPVGGATVTFAAPPSSASAALSSTNALTDSSGIASITATANLTVGGPYLVTASIGSLSTSFSLRNLAPAPYSIAVVSGSGQSAFLNNPFAGPLVAVVRDQFGGTLSGVAITVFAPPSGPSANVFPSGQQLTGPTGLVQVSSSANATAGTYQVNFGVVGTGLSAAFNLTNVPPVPASIAAVGGGGQSATVNTAFTAQLQARVLDTNGQPVPNVTVNFLTPAGASATLLAPSAITNPLGVASISVTANGITGSYAVTATVNGVTGSASFGLTNLPPPPASISVNSGGTQTATLGIGFATPLSVTVKDANNLPLSGVPVTFTAPPSGPSATLSATSVNTNAAGIAQVTAVANGIAGTYNVTASVNTGPGAAMKANPRRFSSANAGSVSIPFQLTNSALVAGQVGYDTSGTTLLCNGASGCLQTASDTVTFGSIVLKYTPVFVNSVTIPSIIGLGYVTSSGTGTATLTNLKLSININSTPPGLPVALPAGTFTGTLTTSNSSALLDFGPGNTITPSFGFLPGKAVTGSGQTLTYQVLNSQLGVQAPSLGNPIGQTSIQGAVSDTTNVPSVTTLTVNGGGTQSTAVSTAFTTPLSVIMRDPNGVPMNGVTVNFTVNPVAGASATLSAASAVTVLGIAQVNATANGTAGSYTVTATSGPLSATFNLSNTAPVVPSGITYDTAGTQLSCGSAASCSPNGTDSVTIGTATDFFTLTYQSATATGVHAPGFINLGNLKSAFTGNPPNTSLTGVTIALKVTSTPPGGSAIFLPGTISGSLGKANSSAALSFSPSNTTTVFGLLPGVAISGTGLTLTYQVSQPLLAVQAPTMGNPPGTTAIQGDVADTTNAPPATNSIAINGGNSQSTTVSTAFTTALSVIVRDQNGTPINNATVNFTVNPGSGGAAATLSAASALTNPSGIAQVNATANGTAGGYTVTATFGTLSASFSLANIAVVTNSYDTSGTLLSCNLATSCLQNSATSITMVANGASLTLTYTPIFAAQPSTQSFLSLGSINSSGTGTNVSMTGIQLRIKVNSVTGGSGFLPNAAISGTMSTNNSNTLLDFGAGNTTTVFGTLPGVVLTGSTFQVVNPLISLQSPTVGNPIGQTSFQGHISFP